MARRTQLKTFPFLEGEHQEVDGKILPDGYLTRAKNVRLRKDSRWGVRADYDAIGNDTGATADIVPRDLVGFGDALCALGDSGGITSDTAIWDIHDYSGVTPAEWTPSAGTNPSAVNLLRLSTATNLRTFAANTPALLQSNLSVTQMDTAAAGGVVCVAYSDGGSCFFHFFRASTGSTLFEATLTGTRPRVVVVSTTFFFLSFDAAAGLQLSKYDPTTDTTATALTAPTASAINCYDAVQNRAGTGFWVVFNRTTPATSIIPYNSSGVAGSAIVGPAVAYTDVTVVETTTRVNLITVTAVPVAELRSYTLAGALSTGPSALGGTPASQVLVIDSTQGGFERVTTYFNNAAGGIITQKFLATSHATGGSFSVGSGAQFLAAKPVTSAATNYHGVLGAVMADGSSSFFSSFLQSIFPPDDNQPGIVSAFTNKFAAAKVASAHIPRIARDSSTGKFYWPTLTVDDQSISRPSLTEFDFLSSSRRQTAQIAGLLYIGGGAIGVYDTRILAQAGVFLKPRIVSATPSNGAGSLPSSTTLLVSYVSEGRDALGNVVEGDIADPSTVTMGVADDTITLALAGNIGIPVGDGSSMIGYRSISGISQLRRAEPTLNSPITFLAADATVRTHGVIYTQAGRASLGAILPHEAPLPADYLWKFGNRLLSANANGAQVSKEIFPGRQVEWSGATGFTIPKISERITGVAALDARGFLFTAERIYQFSGDGPNDAGEGRFSEPTVVPGSTGLMTWQSLVETPIGLFFQGSNGQLWVLPRDGSPPVWIGQPVRDTLVDYPTVTSATLVTKEQLVCFTCNNTGGTDSRIVCYDLRAKTWIVDEFATATPITAACSYQGRLAYLSGGVVYTEKTSLTPGTFIEHALTTGTVSAFGSSTGKYCTVGIVGEYRGDCDLRLRISYDDGKTYTNHGTVFQLRSANGLTAGTTVEREWSPSIRKAQNIRFDFQARSAGSATEGFVFNNWWLETLPSSGGPRKASAERG